MKYEMNLPKKRSAYQYCLLQFFGNLKEYEYENAIAEYEERINRLKQRIVLEKLPDEHFFYQQIKWMQGNRIELLRRTAPYLFKGFQEGGMEEGGMEEGEREEGETEEGYQDCRKGVLVAAGTF